MFDETEWDYASPKRDQVMIQNVGGVHLIRVLLPQLIDETQIQALGGALDGFVGDKAKLKIVLDLGQVQRMSSLALGKLVGLQKKLKELEGAMKLLGLRPSVREIFRASRLDKLFEVFDDEVRAIKSFQKKRKWW